MKEQGTIDYDFYVAEAHGKQLDDLAERLKNVTNSSMETVMHNISANWKGDNAVEYLKKVERIQQDMKKTTQKLETAAEMIRTMSNRWKMTEEANKELTL